MCRTKSKALCLCVQMDGQTGAHTTRERFKQEGMDRLIGRQTDG